MEKHFLLIPVTKQQIKKLGEISFITGFTTNYDRYDNIEKRYFLSKKAQKEFKNLLETYLSDDIKVGGTTMD